MSEIASQPTSRGIHTYQQRFIDNVMRVIANSFYIRRPALRILDAGCDTSGQQLRQLAKLTRGELVGINISDDFPSPEAIDAAGPRVSLIKMNGMDLRFEDASFDMVVSANVMEHVSDPRQYILECARVLKPTGIAYFETAPIWTSARGHHIHEDMIAENCPQEQNYRNDGSVIPDWSHLTLKEAEMRPVLEAKLLPKTCDYVLWYLYQSGDLNKIAWSTIEAALREAFTEIRIHTWDIDASRTSSKPPRIDADNRVFGFAATGRMRRQNEISRRVIWRLRRLGL